MRNSTASLEPNNLSEVIALKNKAVLVQADERKESIITNTPAVFTITKMKKPLEKNFL